MKQIARFIDLELQRGYQVDVVEDGKAGLALIAATKYDLILFSDDLSDMSGETFAKSVGLLSFCFDCFWIAAKKLLSTKYSALCRSYMVKPFIINDLVNKITTILEDVIILTNIVAR